MNIANKISRLMLWGLCGFAAYLVGNIFMEEWSRAGLRAGRHQRALENPEGHEMERAWVRQEVLKDLDRDRERAMRSVEERW